MAGLCENCDPKTKKTYIYKVVIIMIGRRNEKLPIRFKAAEWSRQGGNSMKKMRKGNQYTKRQ